MEHAVGQIVEERADRAVDMAGLAARVAMASDQRRAAIEACRGVIAVRLLTGKRFDRARRDDGAHAIAQQTLVQNPVARHAPPHCRFHDQWQAPNSLPDTKTTAPCVTSKSIRRVLHEQ